MTPHEKMYSRYNSFRQKLLEGVKPSVASENVLLDVFDIAHDMNDHFVQVEALLLAAELFPDSPEFMLRRAYLYDLVGDKSDLQFINANEHNPVFKESALGRIIRLGIKFNYNVVLEPEEQQHVCNEIISIVETCYSLGDEEMFRLRDLASNLKLNRWFVENICIFLPKVENKASWLYEVACLAQEDGMIDESIDLLEQVVEMDAFRHEVWIMLASSYAAKHDYEHTVQALDFAASVRTDTDSILSEASLLAALNLSRESMELGRGLFEKYGIENLSDEDFYQYVSVLFVLNDFKRAGSVLLDRITSSPSPMLFIRYLAISPRDNVEKIALFDSAIKADPMLWIDTFVNEQVLPRLGDDGFVKEAAYLAIVLDNPEVSFAEWRADQLTALFNEGNFGLEYLVRKINEIKASTGSLPVLPPMDGFFYSFAFAKKGDTATALRIAELSLEGESAGASFMEKHCTAFFADKLRMLVNKIETGEKLFLQSDFLPKSYK